jgi:hypothetical protein
MFDIGLAKMDDRAVVRKCDHCEEIFENKWEMT